MTHLPTFFCPLAAALSLALLVGTPVQAQDGEGASLRVQGVVPGGVRTSLTESWGTLEFTLINSNPTGRDARVLVFFPERPDLQYGRDVWVPGRSSLSSWLLVGPAAEQQRPISREVQFLLYDRTGGPERLVLPPGEERVRSRAVLYRRREPTTALLLDEYVAEGDDPDSVAWQNTRPSQTVRLARTFRHAAGLSEHVQILQAQFLPPTAAAFDGIDHLILAGNRLADDPPGRLALRRWLHQGGKLWVLLDLVDPDVVAPLLGDSLGFHVVDRVSLTSLLIQRAAGLSGTGKTQEVELEQPVDFVRVTLPPTDLVLHTVDGWPASFSRQVGRGKVVVTTLGGRGWLRPRTAGDSRSPFDNFRDLPVALPALEELAPELQPLPEPTTFRVEAFRPLLTDAIGYAVVSRGTVGLVFGAFLAVLLALGIGLRRSRRPELVGWLGPVAAVAATCLFLVLGEASRRAVPPTVGVVQMVDAVPGSGEAAVTGLLAVYRPDSGPAPVGSEQGGLLDLDPSGLEGQTRRRVQTDAEAWHWENLALPAGVRVGPIHYTARTGEPLAAVAGFGPDGVEGRLTAGLFQGVADALLLTSARQPVAVRLGPDGTFAAGAEDVLPAGQYLAGTVLTDRQQQRQSVYRQLLAGPAPEHVEGRNILLAWAEPHDIPFHLGPGARTVGAALLVIPVEFAPSPPDTRVTIPSAFLPYRRLLQERPHRPILDSTFAVEMHLRFQVPASVLPLKVERARLVAKVRAPARRFSVAGHADGGLVPLHAVDSPLDPVRLEIVEERLLRLDGQGGLHLNVAVSDRKKGDGKGWNDSPDDAIWRIESLGLEVVGRTLADPR